MSPIPHWLLALAPLSAAPQDGALWAERRAELEALDPARDDAVVLEAALAELAADGPADDPALCDWAGTCAYVLFERLRNAGELARAGTALEHGLALCPDPGGLHSYLWLAQSSLASHLADYAGSLQALDRAEASLSADQREGALPSSIASLRAQAMIQMGVPDRAAPWVAAAIERAEALRGTPAFDAGALLDAYLKRSNLRMATESYALMAEELEALLADEELLAAAPSARARFLVRLGLAHQWSARGDDEAAAQARERFAAALEQPGIQAQDRLTAHLRLAQLELAAARVPQALGPLARARALEREMSAGGGSILISDEALLCALEARAERRGPTPSPERIAAARARLLAAYDALLANWRARPQSDGGVGFLRYPAHQDALAELLECELAAAPGEAGRRAALVQLARAQAVGDLAEALSAREPTWDEIAAQVPAGGGLLVWFGAPEASHVFAVDAAGTEHARAADVRDAQAPREALERLLAQTPIGLPAAALERRRGELAREAALLGELLQPEVIAARAAGWSALTLVVDDLAGASAIALLPLRDGKGATAPLYLSRPVAFLPGLAVGAALLARAPRPPAEREWPRDLCLVTGTKATPEVLARYPRLAPLPIDAQRIDAWSTPFGEARVERLTGAGATLAALSAAPAARVLHFVTHGVRDVERVRPPGLLLAATADHDGLLFDEHTRDLAAPALAALSVCCAGRGPERVGDAGASDLSGSFFVAGADAVMLSLTELPFEPVSRAVPRLHERLVRGESPAEALWRARLELARDPALADPFLGLAALRVLGLGHRPLFAAPAPGESVPPPAEDAPRSTLFVALIAVAVVVPVLLLVLRRRRPPAA